MATDDNRTPSELLNRSESSEDLFRDIYTPYLYQSENQSPSSLVPIRWAITSLRTHQFFGIFLGEVKNKCLLINCEMLLN